MTDEVRENHRPRVVGSRSSTVQVHPLASLPSVIDLMHAAALRGLGRTTANKLVRKGEWPTPIIRIGRPIKIPTAPIRELLSRSNGSRSN